MVTAMGLHLIIYIGEAAEERRAVVLGVRAGCGGGSFGPRKQQQLCRSCDYIAQGCGANEKTLTNQPKALPDQPKAPPQPPQEAGAHSCCV